MTTPIAHSSCLVLHKTCERQHVLYNNVTGETCQLPGAAAWPIVWTKSGWVKLQRGRETLLANKLLNAVAATEAGGAGQPATQVVFFKDSLETKQLAALAAEEVEKFPQVQLQGFKFNGAFPAPT